ncbi:PPC domain-containing protein [Capilliphycus salinus ALCB114379]|uniref:PPC domain-containing protein n=1 Tax=Capilliphycus salinus TaxID=2768948 RepID=UPI0039A59167
MLTFEEFLDEDFYFEQYPAVQAAVEAGEFESGLDHFLQVGQFESLQPNPLFDLGYYRSIYTDVSGAVEREAITEAEHFILFGQFEQRNPNPLFDTAYYLEQYPDVQTAFEEQRLTPFEHFFRFGQFEGRNPSLFFDPLFYQERNPEAIGAIENGVVNSLFEHFLRFGLPTGKLGVSPDPRNDLSGAFQLDTLLGSRTVIESVSEENPADIYRFVIPNEASAVTIRLTELTADADLEILEDLNGNLAVDFDDIFAVSKNLGIASESIIFDELTAGNYYVRVSQFEGETDYNLSFDITPLV